MSDEIKWKGNPRLKCFLIPIDDIKINVKNTRKHCEIDIKATAASLDDHGQQHTILVQKDNTLIAGEGRWLAAKSLGWTHIAAVASDITDEGELKLFAIRDNRTAELSEWEHEELSIQLKYLNKDYDLPSTGLWENHELEQLLEYPNNIEQVNQAEEDTIKNIFNIVIDCETEQEQVEILTKLQKEGYNCRALVS